MKSISSITSSLTSTRSVENSTTAGFRSEMEVRFIALEAIESELETMEKTDLKKLKLLRVAWIISMIVGTAIFFAIPVSMIFGVPLWLPIVISLGLSLVIGYAGGKIANKRQEILHRYEFLRAYRHQLLKGNIAKKPLIKKFDIKKEELFSGLKSGFQKRLEKLRNELLFGKKSADVQDSCSTINALDLQGETFALRYRMQDLLLEEEDNRVASWQEFSKVVADVNNKLVKGECESETLESVSLSALMAGGVQHLMMPPKDFSEKSDKVQRLFKYGAQVISSLQEDFSRYDKIFFNQDLLKEFSPLPDAVRLFRESSNLLLLDILGRLHSLESLNEVVLNQEVVIENLQKDIEAGSSVEKLYSQIYQKTNEIQKLLSDGLSAQRYRTIFGSILSELELLYRQLRFFEIGSSIEATPTKGCADEETQMLLSPTETTSTETVMLDFSKKLKDLTHSFKANLNTTKDQQSVQHLLELLSRIQNGIIDIPLGKSTIEKVKKLEKNQKILRKAQCNFVSKLTELGDESFLNKVRMGTRGCSAISAEINKAIASTPERKMFSCRLLLSSAKKRLEDSYWGVSGADSSESLLGEKSSLLARIQVLENELELLEKDFTSFKDYQLSKLFFKGAQEELQKMTSVITASRSSSQQNMDELKRIADKLGQIGREKGPLSESVFVSPQELRGIVLKYGEFHQTIHTLLSKVSGCVEEVGRGCESNAISFKKLLLEKDSTLSKRSTRIAEEIQKRKDAEKASLANENQQPVKDILSGYLDKLEALRKCMEDFEEVFSAEEIIAEKAFSSADSFLKTLGEAKGDASLVQSVLTALSSSTQELSLNQLCSDINRSKGLTKSDEKVISDSAEEIKKIRNKLASGLENLALQAKQSLRAWNLSKSVATTILSLCMFIAAIFLLNVQLWWLPILFVGVGSVFIGINHIFDKVIENKTKAMVTEQVALKLSVEDCITDSDFGDKNVVRLAELQKNLGLDGCHRTWAQEVVKELENTTTGEEFKDFLATKESAVKQLTSWKRELDRKVNKRFGFKSDSPAAEIFPQDSQWQKRLALLDKEKELLSNEDAVAGRLNRVRTLLQKLSNEQAFSESLDNRVAKGKDLHNRNIRESAFYDLLMKHLTSSIELAMSKKNETSEQVLVERYSRSIIDLAKQTCSSDKRVKEEAIEAFDREVFLAMENNSISDVLNSLSVLCGSKAFTPLKGASITRGGELATSLSKIRRAGCDQLSPVVKAVFSNGKAKLNDVIRSIASLLSSQGIAQGKTLTDLLAEDENSLVKASVAKPASGALSIINTFEKKFSSVVGLRFSTTGDNVVEKIREVSEDLSALREDVISENKSSMSFFAKVAGEKIERLVYGEHVKFRKECGSLRELCAYVEKSLQDPSFNHEGLLKSIIKKLSDSPIYLLKEELSFNKARSLLVKQKIQEYNLLEERSCFVKAIVSEKSKEYQALELERVECEKLLDGIKAAVKKTQDQLSLLQ
ncbi:hypothetical protein [Chlamydiifrater volucris]|uniref:hypothetical protein n=1 Tax=Chlamydiifrater volucris TaxID=2681470 RepID=UPI001BCE11EE|nr:hypothetical protein [Chlamydiifrater volucris]